MYTSDSPFVQGAIWWQLQGDLEDDWVAIEQLYQLPRSHGLDHQDAVRLALGTSIWLTTFEGVRVGRFEDGGPLFVPVGPSGPGLTQWLIEYWRDYPEDGGDLLWDYCLEHPSIREHEGVIRTRPWVPR